MKIEGDLSNSPQPLGPQTAKTSGGGVFGDIIHKAIESMDRGQQQAELEMARAVAGESPDLHRTVVALQTAEINFQLALQVRNKVVGAYEEIMRMQV